MVERQVERLVIVEFEVVSCELRPSILAVMAFTVSRSSSRLEMGWSCVGFALGGIVGGGEERGKNEGMCERLADRLTVGTPVAGRRRGGYIRCGG